MPKEIFTPAEIKILILGLVTVQEDLETGSKNQQYNFTPEARKDMKDMLDAANSARKKLEGVVNKGIAFEVAQYEEGDEKDFLTKQS